MSQNSNWKCDGIPKNDITYKDIGGKHEIQENFGDSCSACGLPKESMAIAPPLLPPSPPWGWIVGTTIVVGGIIAIAMVNPCLFERLFVKCPTEQENRTYTSRYTSASQQASESLNKFLKSGDLKTMQTAREELNGFIEQIGSLKKLKNEKCCPIDVYPLVEKELPGLKANLIEIDAFISVEKLGVEIVNLGQAAQTIDELEKAKNGLKNAIASIDKITSPFLAEKINVKRGEYQKQLNILDEKSKALDEKLKQERIEKQRLAEERQIEEERQRQQEQSNNFGYSPSDDGVLRNPRVPKKDGLPSCDVALFGNCKP